MSRRTVRTVLAALAGTTLALGTASATAATAATASAATASAAATASTATRAVVATGTGDGSPAPAAGSPQILLTVTVPEHGTAGDEPFTVSDASLRWAVSTEAGSGAFFGGCNFLMAGRPGTDGDTHGGSVWTDDRWYHAASGDVSVEKPDASGTYHRASFATRCQAPDGQAVTTANGLATGTQVVVDGGTGTVDPAAGTATIRWTGTFTSVFYGGLTYWWASDPVLTVRADGTGELTATAGGFGTSMEDMSEWDALPATTVVLADLVRVPLDGARGFRVVPRYVGRSVTVPQGATPQVPRTAENAAHWGSFPQSFVDFQALTGQLSYWYASGGQRDAYKVASPVYVSYDADAPVTVAPGDVPQPGTGAAPSNPVVAPPAPSTPTAPATAPGPASAPAGAPSSPAGLPRPGLSGSTLPGTGLPGAGLPGTFRPAPTTVPPSPAPGPAPVALTASGAPTVGGGAGLVPTLTAPPSGGTDSLGYAVAGLLAATAGAVHGFRRGWLVLPFVK